MELNKNQKIVYKAMKKEADSVYPMRAAGIVSKSHKDEIHDAYESLNDLEEAQVLKKFAKWCIKQHNDDFKW